MPCTLHNIPQMLPGGIHCIREVIDIGYLRVRNQNQVVFIFRNLSFFGFITRINLNILKTLGSNWSLFAWEKSLPSFKIPCLSPIQMQYKI